MEHPTDAPARAEVPGLPDVAAMVEGYTGRAAVAERLPGLRRDWALDFVVVNAENASGGMGLTGAHAAALLEAGADCLTLGDHAFDQRDMLSFIESEPRVLRPLNFAKTAPGKGARVFAAPGGRKVFVTQALGQVFMKRPFDDPFSALDAALRPATLGAAVQAVCRLSPPECPPSRFRIRLWCAASN